MAADYVNLAQWAFAGVSPFIGYVCARLEKRGLIWKGWGFTVALLAMGLPQFALMVAYVALKWQ